MKILKDSALIIALLLALFAIAPMLTHAGLPNTADGPAHLMRQVELNEAWKTGILYPRWAPDLALGHGMPLFNYAPPLLYHTSQLLHLSALPLDAAMKGSVILAMLLYSAAMYLFARDLFGPKAGLLAAAVYLYAPYHLREAFIQGNYGQFWGLAFYPLILWAFHKLIITNRRQDIPLAALSLAGLILSHNISSMLFAPLFGAYLIYDLRFTIYDLRLKKSLVNRKSKIANRLVESPLPKVLLAVCLGLGLSAFFWLPAFGEKDLIRLSGITSGFFDFRHNFITLRELLAFSRPLDLSAINPYYPLSLGVTQWTLALLALPGTAILTLGKKIQGGFFISQALFWGAVFFFYAFMTLPASQWMWETIPLVALTEFPWRMLGPAILAAALLAGLGLRLLERWGNKAGWWGLAIGLSFTIGANLVYLVPDQFIRWGTPTPGDAFAYEVSSGAIGTTSAGEFLPRWTESYPSAETMEADYAAGRLPRKIAVITADGRPVRQAQGRPQTAVSHQTLEYTARETIIAVNAPTAFTADLLALYWPFWRVRLTQNGQAFKEYAPDEIEITHPEGLLRVELPAGSYQLHLLRAATPIQRAATAVSVFALAALVGLVGVSWFKREAFRPPLTFLRSPAGGRAKVSPPAATEGRLEGGRDSLSTENISPPQHPTSNIQRPYLILGAAIILSAITLQLAAPLFRVQSPPDAVYRVQQPLQVDFADQTCLEPGRKIRLLGVDLPSQTISPDDEFSLVAYWRALQKLDTNYAVFLHLDAPDGQTVAAVDQLHPNDIPTANWPPSLYLRNPLTLRVPANALPIRYSLRVGLYNPQSGQRLPLQDGSGDAFTVGQVWVEPASPAKTPNDPTARFGNSIRLLGATYNPAAQTITLIWQSDAPIQEDYSIFLHLLDANGKLIGQADGAPYHNLYPPSAWLPGQTVEDTRPIGDALSNTQLSQFAIGVYNLHTGKRLQAKDSNNVPLPDDTLLLNVASLD
ncbi:MAG TPA: hypothetical protein G4N96_13090 [Chloroflexi bacterium]|nr:hypothetical protein [Chloroflexota bacterium]